MQRGKSSSSFGRRRHSSKQDNNILSVTTNAALFNNNGINRPGPPFPLTTSHKGASFKGGKGKGHKGGHGWRPLNGGGGGAGSGQHLRYWGPGRGAGKGKGKGGSTYGSGNGSGNSSSLSSSDSEGKGSFGDNLQRSHWHRLHAACILGDLNFARAALLEVADDPTAQAAAVGAADEDGLLAWHFAALVGLVPLLELLAGPMIASGVPLEARAGGGQTALHLAAEQGHLDAVEWLLAGPLCGHNHNNKMLAPLPLLFGENDVKDAAVADEETSGKSRPSSSLSPTRQHSSTCASQHSEEGVRNGNGEVESEGSAAIPSRQEEELDGQDVDSVFPSSTSSSSSSSSLDRKSVV